MAEETQLTTDVKTANPVVEQIVDIYKQMPLQRKIVIGVVVALVLAGFAGMFFWASQIEFQPVYTGLSSEDASQIVEKLKEKKMPYKLAGDGSVVMVPASQVYDARLYLAGSGLPKGGGVGFEIFDEADFGATEFVQKLNYQRALQGELARTIREFSEIENARVMIVMPKDSLFIEESRPASASVLLKLRSDFSKEKISAVVNLVAGAVEGLDPNMITVVDTHGNVLSTGVPEDESESFANKQLDYKMSFEKNLTGQIQTMLEKIVGKGKAIVRVTADMDFNQVDTSEEIYDPDTTVVRSKHNITESSDNQSGPGDASSVNPLVPGGGTGSSRQVAEKNEKLNETINFEINKTIRRTVRPVGLLSRLSVAAVLDGTYVTETDNEGKQSRKYVERTKAELDHFTKIVQQAMGYNADREDQVSVESFPFSYMEELDKPTGVDWQAFSKRYGRSIVNILLVLLVFMFVIIPLVKMMKKMNEAIVDSAVLAAEEKAKALIPPEERDVLPELDVDKMSVRAKASYFAKEDIQKTTTIMRSWLKEAS